MRVNAIDQLVLKTESNKELIKAICETYLSSQVHRKHCFADFIQGKGEGQVILLHGPPGTGKTLTAGKHAYYELFNFALMNTLESVADFTKRPLLTITAADLGHDPTTLEGNLLTFFRDATDWDAIVLLDEAD